MDMNEIQRLKEQKEQIQYEYQQTINDLTMISMEKRKQEELNRWLQSENKRLKGQIQNQNTIIESLDLKMHKSQIANEKLQQQILEFNEHNKQLQSALNRTHNEKLQLANELEIEKQINSKLTQKLQRLGQQSQDYHQHCEALQQQYNLVSHELEVLRMKKNEELLSTNISAEENENVEILAGALPLKYHDVGSIMQSPNRNSRLYVEKIAPQCGISKQQGPSVKTPKPSPDISVVMEEYDAPRQMYEAFFIIGASINQGKGQPEILVKYPENQMEQNSQNLKAIGNFCYPSGVQIRRVKLDGSMSEIQEIIYGGGFTGRDSNHFIFTLKSEEYNENWCISELPNSEHEILYCICISIEDLSDDSKWITPKCYCIVSYIPFFELHFKVLQRILEMRHEKRIQEIFNEGLYANPISEQVNLLRDQFELDEREISLLTSYRKPIEIEPGLNLSLSISKKDFLQFPFPRYLQLIDALWCAPILFSQVTLKDLLYLIIALMQEKSIIFVGYNLDKLTSCVLALNLMIRPFKWPNLLTPVLPNSLREIIEAPIPILVGLHGQFPSRRKHINAIWVNLDEPQIDKRMSVNNEIEEELIQLNIRQLRQSIYKSYRKFQNIESYLQINEDFKNYTQDILEKIWNYWETAYNRLIADIETSNNDIESISTSFLNNSDAQDYKFWEHFTNSQIFFNTVDMNRRARYSV